MLEEKSSEQIKSKEKKDKKKKAPEDANSAEDGQFEEKMDPRKDKKKKKEEFRPQGTDSTYRVSEKIKGGEIDMVEEKNKEKLDGRKEKRMKKKKEEFRSHGTDSTSRVSEKMEASEIYMVEKRNKEKLDGRKEKKEKKKKKKEEFGSHGTDSTSRVSEIDMVEKKNNKRKRAIDREDLEKKEKKRKIMSKGNSAGLDKDMHYEETVVIYHDNLEVKKEKEKYLSGAGAVELEERNKDENGDDRLEERKEEKYEVAKKRRRKKEKGGSSGNMEKEINEEEEKAENMRKGDEKKKEGSKTNKRVKEASKSEEKGKNGKKEKGKKTTTGNNEEKTNSENRKERKKVQFSDEVEVFSAPRDSIKKTKRKRSRDEREGLVWGKRFTKEEDATILKAIDDYIKVKQLGEMGREIVLDSQKHKLGKGIWRELAACLPHRPFDAVYFRARNLLQKNATEWTPEDFENLRQFQAAHGNQWRKFADLYSKNSRSVKDVWRYIKIANQNKGPWTQEEYQALFDLVNLDLQLKAFTEEPETHCVLRDNISWEAISCKLGTRNNNKCCIKWYNQLTSPLVRDNLWADTDDYRLLIALHNVDASCIEEVDWDNLLPHRDGEICQKRWLQMVRYIGEHKERPFIEQVGILSKRYCPDMLEYRAEKDKKKKM